MNTDNICIENLSKARRLTDFVKQYAVERLFRDLSASFPSWYFEFALAKGRTIINTEQEIIHLYAPRSITIIIDTYQSESRFQQPADEKA